MFAAAVLLWVFRLRSAERRPPLGGLAAALALYVGWSALSWAVRGEGTAAFKLLGLAELGALLVVTADLLRDQEMRARVGMAVGLTSLAAAAAALAGEVLFLRGWPTALVGTYGDLVPGHYARAQAGLTHPNLLASFCVFASTVVAWGLADRHPRLARVVQAALLVAVTLSGSRSLLTFGLAAVLRGALRRGRRLLALAATLAIGLVLLALTLYDLRLDPTRPWDARWTGAPSARAVAFVSASRSLLAHPWLGVGLGHAPAIVDGAPFEAHCTPLDIASTVGLPALFAFSGVVWFVWRRSSGGDPTLRSGLVALALDGLTQDVADFRHLWVLFGLAAAPRAAASP